MPPKKKLDDSMITQDVIEYVDQFDFENQLFSASMTCALAGIEDLMSNFKKELDIKKLMRIIPDYNAEYCIETAYQVNDVAIKSYDMKKDDPLIFDEQAFLEDNQEPAGPGQDPFKIDNVARNIREIQEPSASENDFNRSVSNSSVGSVTKQQRRKKNTSRSSILKIQTQHSVEKMMDGLSAQLQSAVQIEKEYQSFANASPNSRTGNQSPMKMGNPKRKQSRALIVPVDAPLKINMDYQENRKYTDGISEDYLDKQRILLQRKNESLLNALKLKDKKNRFSQQNQQNTKSGSKAGADGSLFDNGEFIQQKRINTEKLPEMGGSVQKLQFERQHIAEILKPGDESMNREFDVYRKIEEMKEAKRQQHLELQEKERQDEIKRHLQNKQRASRASAEKSMFQSSIENSQKANSKSKASLGKIEATQDSTEISPEIGDDEVNEEPSVHEPPPLDMNRIGVYNKEQRQPITAFISNDYLRSYDSSGQAIPTRDSIQVQLGVKFSEGPDSARQLAAITLGGGALSESPEHKNKIMSKEDLVSKQMSEKGEYVKSMIDKRSQINDQFGTESDLISYMKTGDANLLQESSVPESMKGFEQQFRSVQPDGAELSAKQRNFEIKGLMLPQIGQGSNSLTKSMHDCRQLTTGRNQYMNGQAGQSYEMGRGFKTGRGLLSRDKLSIKNYNAVKDISTQGFDNEGQQSVISSDMPNQLLIPSGPQTAKHAHRKNILGSYGGQKRIQAAMQTNSGSFGEGGNLNTKSIDFSKVGTPQNNLANWNATNRARASQVITLHRKEKDQLYPKPPMPLTSGGSKVLLAPLSQAPLEKLRTSTRGQQLFDSKLEKKNLPDRTKKRIVSIGNKLHERLDFKESKPEKQRYQ